MDGRSIVILSPGWRGDAAGEIYRLDLDGPLPADLSRRPAVRIPFSDPRAATLGSLAIDARTRELYLGDENGGRVWRLTGEEQLTLYASGLHRLVGGAALAFDARGRLLIVDFADPLLSEGEQRPPAGLGVMDVSLEELVAVAGVNVAAVPVMLLCAVLARGYVRGLTAAMVEGS